MARRGKINFVGSGGSAAVSSQLHIVLHKNYCYAEFLPKMVKNLPWLISVQ
jgi:hypothetical protein